MTLQTDFDEATARGHATRDGITHLSTGVAVARDGKVLLVRRVGHDTFGGQYELPGGGVDEGESVTTGAIREIREEVGLTVTKVLGTFPGFEYTTPKKPHVRQFNFLVEVAPGDIVLDPNEHDAYVWADESSLDTLTTSDEMRSCVRDALQLLRSL